MSNRELVIDLINKLPEDTPLTEIAREIEFVAGIREALAQADRGEGTPAEEVKRLVDAWATPSS
jgi:predicted transcriptional regulator